MERKKVSELSKTDRMEKKQIERLENCFCFHFLVHFNSNHNKNNKKTTVY